MEQFLDIIGKLPEMITALVAIVAGLVAFFMAIPGDQPEKFLKGVLDVISKFSKK